MLRFLVILASVLVPSVCRAQESSQFIEYDGIVGFFFDENTGTKIIKDLATFKQQEHVQKLLETKLSLVQGKVVLLDYKIEILTSIANKHKEAYVLENKLRVADSDFYLKKLKATKGFFKSSGFWFGAGFILSAALSVGLTFGLQEVRE